MKIAVIYNRQSQKVINLFGLPNQEKYGLAAIKRIVNALRKGGHQVIALEGDKDLIENLEEFMPRVIKGERPGMAFNLSYGIQGQARYTHVPGMLEMVGIPYVGSGPLAHSLALDKVVAKMIFRQHGLPTPDFTVLDAPGFALPDLEYPLIVKPKNEAVSFGIRIVHDDKALREAADAIFERFQQPVLVERYIEGREINVGLLGTSPAEPLPPAEIIFGEGGPRIYTYEDKTRRSGREIGVQCPAPIDAELTQRAQTLARQAFHALGCFDCARVDMRLDDAGNLYILEVNSLPSLGEHGSYVAAAEAVGMDFAALVNRLVDVASARYFGTPTPPRVGPRQKDPQGAVFSYLTQRRDAIEGRLKEWVSLSGRTHDPIGLQLARKRLEKSLLEIGLVANPELSGPTATTWQTAAGLDGGTLLVAHLDVPIGSDASSEPYHREPEWLYGEGIGSSRAPLVMLEYSLRALRAARRLRELPLGVLCYSDEGADARESAALIRAAAARAARVIVLRPGNLGEKVITKRRGQRKYRLIVEGEAQRLGHGGRKPEPLRWLFERLEALSSLSNRKERLAVAVTELKSQAYPLLLPHRVTAAIMVSYANERQANQVEQRMRDLLAIDGAPGWDLSLIADRPAMPERRSNGPLYRELAALAAEWEIPFEKDASLWPSVAGLVPAKTPVVCGMGPVTRDLYTAREAVSRISLVQRMLLLSQFLLKRN